MEGEGESGEAAVHVTDGAVLADEGLEVGSTDVAGGCAGALAFFLLRAAPGGRGVGRRAGPSACKACREKKVILSCGVGVTPILLFRRRATNKKKKNERGRKCNYDVFIS